MQYSEQLSCYHPGPRTQDQGVANETQKERVKDRWLATLRGPIEGPSLPKGSHWEGAREINTMTSLLSLLGLPIG